MEVRAAEVIFSRSMHHNGLHYVTGLCDGNRKACNQVGAPELYNKHDREDCITHVAKAVYARPDELKTANNGLGDEENLPTP